MNVAFFGTPEFSLAALGRLIESRHQVVLVVTQPDRPKGRGRKLEASPVKQMASDNDLPMIQPVRVSREPIAEAIREAKADICVVVAFGQILPRKILDATRLGCINIHPSLLPAYRGAAPIQRSILDGATQTGVSIMQLDAGMDTGPVIAQQRVEILPDDDARSLGEMLSVVGADMLMHVLDEAEQNERIESVAQDDALATSAPPVRKEEGSIPWSDTTDRIMFRLRAMTPWPGAYTFINGEKRLTLLQAEPLWVNEADVLGAEAKQADPGTVTSIKIGFGFTVKTGSGHLLVTSVKPQGKQQMDAAAFVNGRGIAEGDRLMNDKGQRTKDK